jgi:hypothetical protein
MQCMGKREFLARVVRARGRAAGPRLGFESLSEYATSVMRSDLLLGGKHQHFPNNDFHPEILAALDRETLNEFLKSRKPKNMLDFLLEEAAKKGREQTQYYLRKAGREEL